MRTLTKINRPALAAALALSLSACLFHDHDVHPERIDPQLFHLDRKPLIVRLQGLSMQQQYDYFLVGNQQWEPPLALDEAFAKDGPPLYGFFTAKLAEAKDEITLRDIAEALDYLQRFEGYNVAANPALMAQLKARVGAMHGGWAPVVQEMLVEIRQGPPKH